MTVQYACRLSWLCLVLIFAYLYCVNETCQNSSNVSCHSACNNAYFTHFSWWLFQCKQILSVNFSQLLLIATEIHAITTVYNCDRIQITPKANLLHATPNQRWYHIIIPNKEEDWYSLFGYISSILSGGMTALKSDGENVLHKSQLWSLRITYTCLFSWRQAIWNCSYCNLGGNICKPAKGRDRGGNLPQGLVGLYSLIFCSLHLQARPYFAVVSLGLHILSTALDICTWPSTVATPVACIIYCVYQTHSVQNQSH